MNRCVSMSAFWCLVLIVTVANGQGQESQQRSKPNVLFIAIDDLNDWIGCLEGHPLAKTPHMDRLAARGTLFLNAHCQSPLCNPSRTSLLTGLRPSTTGVYGLAPWFRTSKDFAEVVTLPQHFKQNGYRTYSTGKIFHGGYPPRNQRAAEVDQWGPGAGVGARPAEKLVTTPGGNHPLVDWGTFPHRDEDKGDWHVADWAIDRLEEGPQEPFFLSVGFFLPHVPCYATQPWFDLYPDDDSVLPPIKNDDRDDVPDFAWYLHWDLPEPRTSWLREEKQLQPLSRAYLATISFVDSQVGRVLDALEESGHADDTIVVLWSDHGFHLGEKAISGKNSLWERSTRVPLIFAGPGVASGARCGQPAELLDMYPTLIELCNLADNDSLEGISLVPQLRDAGTERERPAITTHNQNNHSIRSQRYRLIQYADGSEEFYDMEKDPNEWDNLINNASLADLIENHRRWIPEVNAPPMPGSAHRILVKVDGQWMWEGRPVIPSELVK